MTLPTIGLAVVVCGRLQPPRISRRAGRQRKGGVASSCSTARTSTAGRPKIKGYELGDNFGNTFRVEDGVLKVAYDKYEKFDGKFGHLFYEKPFSHYILRVEYRFVGEQSPGGPGWAFRNSGDHDPRPVAREHGQGPGVPRLDRSPVARRQRPGQPFHGQRLHAGHALRA